MAKAKVLIADDHTMVRDAITFLLHAEPEFQVVASVANGRDAVATANATRPDFILMEPNMPIMNGVTATRLILNDLKDAKVLALSASNDEKVIDEMIAAGASGYLLKDSASSDLLDAMRRILKGGTAFSPTIEKRLLQRQHLRQFEGTKKNLLTLTVREAQTLQLIAEGFTNKAIAAELQISIKTVEKHRQQVMNKLNIHDIASLTRYAIANKLISPPSDPSVTQNPEPDV
jgi:DNA-binding NarL/FixJ family response regulator